MIRDVQLWIDHKYIDLTANDVRLNSVTPWIKDEVPNLLLTHEPIHPVAEDPWINKTVALWIDDGTVTAGYTPPDPTVAITAPPDPVAKPWWRLIFLGQMHRRTTTNSKELGWVYGYEALGLDYMASQWPIVSPFDGTGTVTFNLAATDPNYDSTYSGLSVGEMILMLLEEASTAAHFDQLAKLTDPKDGRYIGAALGNYKYVTDPINRLKQYWQIDERTRKDILEDGYLGYTKVGSTSTKIVPTLPVTFNGDDWLQGVRAVVQAYAPNHVLWVEPVYEQLLSGKQTDPKRPIGIIRLADTAKDFSPGVKRNPAKRVEMKVQEHPLPSLQRNYQNSFSRVVVRGGPDVQPVVLKMSKGELVEDFVVSPYGSNDAAKAAWNLTISTSGSTKKYNAMGLCRRPRIKAGTINEIDPTIQDPADANNTIPNPQYISNITSAALKSSSSFLVQSANETITLTNGTLSNVSTSWPNHLLSQNSDGYGGTATVSRINLVANQPQWQITDVRAIADNTAWPASADGCYLSFNATLSTDDATRCTIATARWPGFATWRRYKINKFLPDGTSVAKRVQAAFPVPIDWKDDAGQIIRSAVTKGSAYVIYNAGGREQRMEWDFVTDRNTEHIIFGRPTVMAFGDYANLTTGGANTTGIPTDLWVFVPVSGKAMEVACPPDKTVANTTNPNLPTVTANYAGTCYTEDKLTRTKYVNDLQWTNWKDLDVVKQWGNQLLASVQDTIVEGPVPVLDYKCFIGFGWWVEWKEECPYPDSDLVYDRLTSDIRGCTITWDHGDSVVPIRTDLTLSNRRDPYSSQTPIIYHPAIYQSQGARQQTISWGSDSFAYTQSDAISKFTTDLDNQITGVQTNLNVKLDPAAGAAEVKRLREAGLDMIISPLDLGLEAAQMSAESAAAAQTAGEWAAKNDDLSGDGQGWSGQFHTADGNIAVGYGTDGRSYKPGGAK